MNIASDASKFMKTEISRQEYFDGLHTPLTILTWGQAHFAGDAKHSETGFEDPRLKDKIKLACSNLQTVNRILTNKPPQSEITLDGISQAFAMTNKSPDLLLHLAELIKNPKIRKIMSSYDCDQMVRNIETLHMHLTHI